MNMSMQRLLRWLWNRGQAIAPLILAIVGASLVHISCQNQGSAPQVGRAMLTKTHELTRSSGDLAPPGALSATTVPTYTAPAARRRGGTLRVGGVDSLDWENPLWGDLYHVGAAESLVFESLLELDPQDGHLVPGLAENWTVGPGGRVITFTVRGGVTWHDGHPFSAEDVAFTWRAVISAPVPIPHAEHTASVSKVRVPEERTVVVHLRQPDCPALTQLGLLPILPAHLWKASEVAQPIAYPALLVGTGPFRLADWELGEAMTLTRQADYWAGEPYLDSWTYRRYETPEALEAAALAGDVGLFLVTPWPEPSSGLADGFRLLSLAMGESLYLLFNQQGPGLSERDVRHGLALAVDRKRLATQIGGEGGFLTSLLPPGHWSLPLHQQPPAYDPGEAARLLALQAELPSVSIKVLGGDRLREDVALLVAQAYRQAGIDARLEVLGGGAFFERLFHHEFDVALVAHPFPRDPDQTSLWHSREVTQAVGFNFGSYVSSQADELLEAGRTAEGCSEAVRASVYCQLSELLAQDRPADFLLAPEQVLAVDREVIGTAPSPFAGLYWNVAQWSIAETGQ
jgi:peptide/nickel transport system substrate-binding protein